jgi:hypothetical protein
MSIRVDLSELAAALGEFDYGYLLTVGDDGRAHAVSVTPSVDAGGLRVGDLGRRTVSNLSARANISFVFPPREVGGYSLIVDGDARLDGDAVLVSPTAAVLHRPAPIGAEPPAAGACGADCQPISVTS